MAQHRLPCRVHSLLNGARWDDVLLSGRKFMPRHGEMIDLQRPKTTMKSTSTSVTKSPLCSIPALHRLKQAAVHLLDEKWETPANQLTLPFPSRGMTWRPTIADGTM